VCEIGFYNRNTAKLTAPGVSDLEVLTALDANCGEAAASRPGVLDFGG